jgi:hypothetical protein
VVEDAQKMVKFIKVCHVPLALFCKHATIHAQGLSMLSPGATRFATNFLIVARVLDVKEPVRTQAREVKRLILSDDSESWQHCANYCTVMKVVVAALKEFHGKKPCMGNAYIIMRALHHHVAALYNALFNMPLAPSRGTLRSCLQEERSHGDLHYTAILVLFAIHTSLKIWNFVMTNKQ